MAGLVATLSFLETSVLAFGVGLVYPIVALVIGGPDATGFAKLDNVFMRYFPNDLDIPGAFGLLLLIFIVKTLLSLARIWTTRKLTESLRVEWSSVIASNMYRKTLQKHHEVRDGTKVGTIAREPKLAARCIVGSVTYFVNLLAILFMFALAVYASWQATLAFTLIGGGLTLFLRVTLLRKIQKLGELRLHTNHRFVSEIVEAISAIKDVKAMGLEESVRGKMDLESRELGRISVLSSFLTEIPVVLTDLIAISVFFAFVYLQLSLNDGNITSLLPEIALFFAVLAKLFSAGKQAISARARILANIASLNHIIKTITDPDFGQDQERFKVGEAVKSFDTDISFKAVTFGYSADTPVLSGVDLTFPKGRVTYVVGPSGIGKTTLVDLLLRYYKPQSGRIEVNGRPITDFELASWRERIGYVSQDALLFTGSISDNISLGTPDATDAKIIWAAEAVGAANFINELPEGYNTIVGERGVTLSGGQRMRIAIARAAARYPELVIIDEGTARFELSLEAHMIKTLRALPSSPTVIIITHRRESTELGDHVIDFQKIRSQPHIANDSTDGDVTRPDNAQD